MGERSRASALRRWLDDYALRFGANRVRPLGAGPGSHVASCEVFFATYTPRRKMIRLLSAEGGNQEGTPVPSWSFPGTKDGRRRSPVGCSLLFVMPAIRLAAGRLCRWKGCGGGRTRDGRRGTEGPGRLLSSTCDACCPARREAALPANGPRRRQDGGRAWTLRSAPGPGRLPASIGGGSDPPGCGAASAAGAVRGWNWIGFPFFVDGPKFPKKPRKIFFASVAWKRAKMGRNEPVS